MTVKRAAQAAATSQSGRYGVLRKHESLEIGYYRPQSSDPQEPHDQDEVYLVQAGSGKFVLGENVQNFETGEVLFVPAGVEHRFVDFTSDFAAWVVFYGPTGGEAGR